MRGGGCPPLPFPGLPSWMGTGSFPPPGSLPRPLRAAATSVPETTTRSTQGPEPAAAPALSPRRRTGAGATRCLPAPRQKIHLQWRAGNWALGPVPRAAPVGCSQQNAVLPELGNAAGIGTALRKAQQHRLFPLKRMAVTEKIILRSFSQSCTRNDETSSLSRNMYREIPLLEILFV